MFTTTTVGSLPKPDWLAEPERLWAPWRLEGQALQRGKERAALEWLREQEAAGIDVVGDGEQFRVHFVHGFLEQLEGIDWNLKTPLGIRNNRYVAEVPTVTAPLRRTRPVHVADAAFMRANTRRRLKITLPGPMTICDTLADRHYGDRARMAMRFAELLNAEALEIEAAGADVIQVDEPAFNVFLDEVRDWGLPALERALQGLKCTTVVHICYGYGIEANIQWKQTLGGQWRQYERIFPWLNASSVRQVSLEFAGSRVPHEVLRLLPDQGAAGRRGRGAAGQARDARGSRAQHPRGDAPRRQSAAAALHQLRHGAAVTRAGRGQAARARRRRSARATEARPMRSPQRPRASDSPEASWT